MTLVSAQEAYKIWAPEYDKELNPLLALEARVVRERLGPLDGKMFLDAGAGTGRWMKVAHAAGAQTFGLDLSPEMLALASGSLVRGDIRRLPFIDRAFDIAVCSMTAGYVPSFPELLSELMRVASRVVVSDLHPAAAEGGWTRSFTINGAAYEIEHHIHAVLDLNPDWFVEECFGAPERPIFEAASRLGAFEDARRVPAIYAACWMRDSH